MKKFVVGLVLALACMSVGVAFTADKGMTKPQKDECLLSSKDCMNATLSIQQKLKKLDKEIKKGNKTYSADEIKKLEQQLKDTEKQLDQILMGG